MKTKALTAVLILVTVLANETLVQAGNHMPDLLPAPRLDTDAMLWQQVSAGLESPFALWFAPDYASSGRVWAAMDYRMREVGYGYGRIYRSADRGASWQAVSPLGRRLLLAAFAPTGGGDPLILALESYADAASQSATRLVRSTTGGASWETVWDRPPTFSALIFSPDFVRDRTIFAVWDDSAAGGIWKSNDGGVTWHPGQRIRVSPVNGHIVSLTFSPTYASDQTLYASVPPHTAGGTTYPGGVYRSQDAGVTWGDPMNTGCVGPAQKLVTVSNAGGGHAIYALGDVRIYRSLDSGASWACPAIEPQATGLLDIAPSPTFPADRTLVLATGQGLKRSTDGGASWSQMGWAGTPVWRVYLSPAYAQDRTLAVALLDGDFDSSGAPYPGGTFLSQDNGAAWQTAGIARIPVRSLALSSDFANDQRVWAASGDGSWAAYRSADAGAAWLRQPYYNVIAWAGFSGMAAAQDLQGNPVVYAVTPIGGSQAGVYKSTNLGMTYSLLAGSPQFVNALATAMTGAGARSVWVGNYQGVHRSLSDGASWTLRNGDLSAGAVVSLAIAPSGNTPDDHTVFAVLTGAQAGVYRSADSGNHWTKLALPGGAVARHVSLSPEYAADATLWVATAAHGILRSADGGDTWQAPATVLSNCGPAQVTGEGTGRQLWAACDGSLVASTDGGVQWSAAGPSGVTVAAVATSPLAKTVFLGTANGGGIWRGRSDTSTVAVLDQAGAPVAGAEVYRNGALAGRTGATGTLQTPLAAGDRLIARKLLKTEPSTRGYHNPGGGESWIYRLYITSLAIPATGEPAPAVVSNPEKVQYLTVRKDNTLIGFNLVASVEWDASGQYLEDLRQGFALASRGLYDASNGQMLFERVSIYDNAVAMASADAQIRASNTAWPHAHLAGLLSRPERRVSGNYFWTGPYFNGAISRAGQWTQLDAYSMLLHEFGHYGLEVHDSYYYYDWRRVKQGAFCTSIANRYNDTPDINATLMDAAYNATEFAMRGVPGAWADVCLQTAQQQWDKRSDWETIVAVYGDAAGQWKLKTPADYGQVVAGPHAIPVARWSRAEVAADAQTGVCSTQPTIQVWDSTYGIPVGGTNVLLQRSGRLIDLGATDWKGEITLLGAGQGDWAIYEARVQFLGAADTAQVAFDPGSRSISKVAVVCPAGQAQAAVDEAHASAGVVVQPAAYDLWVETTPSDPPTPQQAALRVKASTALVSPPMVTWMQVGAAGAVTPPLSYDPAAQAYVGSLPLASGLPMQGMLLVDAVDTQQRKVHTMTKVHLETITPTVDQRIVSADGRAELFLPANSLQGEGQVSWQAQWVDAPAPDGLELIAGPYDLRVSVALAGQNRQAELAGAGLSLYYLERSTGGEHIDLDSLQIYAWDGQRWTALDTTVIDAGKLASAAVPFGDGAYALFGRWQSQSQLFLPLLRS